MLKEISASEIDGGKSFGMCIDLTDIHIFFTQLGDILRSGVEAAEILPGRIWQFSTPASVTTEE
jgi:hypothetical protein